MGTPITPSFEKVVSNDPEHRHSQLQLAGATITNSPDDNVGGVQRQNAKDQHHLGTTATTEAEQDEFWNTRLSSMSQAVVEIAQHNLDERTYFEQKLQKLDLAVEDVLKLLKRDSLVRFHCSQEYARLMQRTLTDLDSVALEAAARASISRK